MINSDLLTPFGRLIRSARLQRDLTLPQAAEKIGVDCRRLGHYELGLALPGIERSLVMAEFYGISLEEFFEKRNQKETTE